MGTILQLVTKFVADVNDYKKNIEGAQKSTNNMKSALTNTAKVAGGIMVAGVGAVAAATGYAVNKAVAWGNELDTISDHLGTTSQESAGLALMMERTGGDSDLLTRSFDKLTAGLMNANGELGPTGKAMEQLGINAFDMDGKARPAAELFQEIADKLAPMEDGLSKNSIMMDLFGKSGVEMGDALGAAADGGVKKFQEEAERLGLAFTPEKTQSIIDAQKKWDELKKTWEGIVTGAGADILPLVTDLLDNVLKWVQSKEGRKAMADVAKLLKDIATSAGQALDWISRLNPEVLKLFGAFGVTAGVAKILLPILAALSLPVAALVVAVVGLITVIAIFGRDAVNTWKMVRDIVFEVIERHIKRNIDTLVGAINGIGSAVSGVIGWIKNLASEFGRLRIPSWLTPGSPTPLENGLRGINDAMSESVSKVLPSFKAQLNIQGAPGSGSGGINPVPEPYGQFDYKLLAIALRDSLQQAGVGNV